MALRRSTPPYRLLALVAALLLGGCGGALPPENRLELTITAAGYSPARLEAQLGAQVVITFQNRDTVAHNVTIELPSGRRAVSAEPRVDAVLNFPANAAGTFRFFCAVPGHTEEGEIVISR